MVETMAYIYCSSDSHWAGGVLKLQCGMMLRAEEEDAPGLGIRPD